MLGTEDPESESLIAWVPYVSPADFPPTKIGFDTVPTRPWRHFQQNSAAFDSILTQTVVICIL